MQADGFFEDCKDTTNYFAVAINFVFENGARKTFLINALGGKAYFESGSLKAAHDDKYKEKLKSIIKDEKIGNYINRKLRNNEYPEEEKYRLGDSEVSFLYAINKVAKFQIDRVQSLAKKITHKLARIELHGYMCPCCYSYMNCFLEQSNRINLKSEKTNNVDPKDKGKGVNGSSDNDVFEHKSISKQSDNGNKNGNANLINSNGFKNFFKCLLDQESIKEYLPKDKQIPINFFISSLVELDGKAYEFGVYQKGKLPDAREIDTKKGINLYCILLRKEGSKNLSQKGAIVENKDCFYLNRSGAKCRFCGNDELSYDNKSEQTSVKNNKPLGNDAFCVEVNNGTVQWYRIQKNKSYKTALELKSKNDRNAMLKTLERLNVPELLLQSLPTTLADFKKIKQKDLNDFKKDLEDNDIFAYNKNFESCRCVTNSDSWEKIKWKNSRTNKEVYCSYYFENRLNLGYINWDKNGSCHVNEFPSKYDAPEFKQAKAIYNANRIIASPKRWENDLDKGFREYLGKHLEHISKPIGKGLLYEITTPQATHADAITEENSQITKEDNVSPFKEGKFNVGSDKK